MKRVRFLWFGDVPLEDINRVADVFSVALISIATVVSAWCGYQSSRWSGVQTGYYNQALAYRVEASEASDKAVAMRNLQVGLFLSYINAYAANDQALVAFIHSRFPEGMRPAVDAWIATRPLKNLHAPSSPFVMPQYHLEPLADAEKASKSATEAFAKAQAANQQSDDYVLFTVFFASLTFIGGISTKLRYPMPVAMLALGMTFLVILGVEVIRLPIQ